MAKKVSRNRWVQQWVEGGIGSIEARMTQLMEELDLLQNVRKALAPVEAVITHMPKGKTASRRRAATRRKAKAKVKGGELRELVLGVLTTTGMPVRAIGEKVGKKMESIYDPLYKLAKEGKAVKSMHEGVQVWRRVS